LADGIDATVRHGLRQTVYNACVLGAGKLHKASEDWKLLEESLRSCTIAGSTTFSENENSEVTNMEGWL
jgi:hypothetical protein